jgi:cyclopropane fatty-acyl-phospholipid synthase-like methyltransferase
LSARAFATPEYTHAKADCLARLLRVAPPARILDVPCGKGRLSLELASRRFEVTGEPFRLGSQRAIITAVKVV